MNDAVHIQVEAVKLWNPVFGYQLRDRRISLTHPSEELRDTHCRDAVALLERLLRDLYAATVRLEGSSTALYLEERENVRQYQQDFPILIS